jgi:hypothetical protein
MARQLSHTLAAEYPEYVATQNLLKLAALTWPNYGISAGDLAEMDDWSVELLRTILTE